MMPLDPALVWGPSVSSHTAQRDYPIANNSLILSMTDMVWTPPHQTDTMHAHNCMEIGVCMEGSGVIRMGSGGTHPFEPGTVIIVPQGLLHTQQNKGQPVTRWRYLTVDETQLLEEAPARSRPEIARLIKSASRQGIMLQHESSAAEAAWLVQRMFDIRSMSSWDAMAELEIIVMLLLVLLDLYTTNSKGVGHRVFAYKPCQSAIGNNCQQGNHQADGKNLLFH